MNWIKDNFAVIALVIGLFVGYAELRLPTMVSAEMDKRGLVKAGDVAAIKDDLKDLETLHSADTDEWKRRIEKIVDILLEE